VRRTQQSRDFARGYRLAEQIALHFGATRLAQPFELLIRLDAFGRRGNAEAQSELSDCPDDRQAIPALGKVGNERAVDLDFVEGNARR
jgi:hypothetical protein